MASGGARKYQRKYRRADKPERGGTTANKIRYLAVSARKPRGQRKTRYQGQQQAKISPEQARTEQRKRGSITRGNNGNSIVDRCRSLLIPRKTRMRTRQDASRHAMPVEEAVPGDERRHDRVVEGVERQRPGPRERQGQCALIARR